jgi:secondary thiamine-phosphate synthase enzyme
VYRQIVFTVETRGRGTHDLTRKIDEFVQDSGIRQGLCHVFVQHTSASLILCENADPTVRGDLERYMAALVPDGDPRFRHVAEGPDDMPAHVRTVLTHSDLTVPVTGGRCALGTWQGIYLWEHRTHPHRRRVVVTLHGE